MADAIKQVARGLLLQVSDDDAGQLDAIVEQADHVKVSLSANTGVQAKVPDWLRGRVMGVYMAVNVGSAPLGQLGSGWMADRWGAPSATAFGAISALVILAVAGAWLFLRRHSPELALDALAPSPEAVRVAELARAAG